MNKFKFLIVILVGAIIAGFLLIGKAPVEKVSLGRGIDLPYNTNATGTIVTVKNIPTQVLAVKSGRAYFRLTNTGTSTISCAITSSTASMIDGAGIIIEQPHYTTSTKTYFDSGESNINWGGAVNCITSVTTTMATFEK